MRHFHIEGEARRLANTVLTETVLARKARKLSGRGGHGCSLDSTLPYPSGGNSFCKWIEPTKNRLQPAEFR